MEALIGNGADVITLLMLFIVGLLTKRFVPWWVHEEALRKLQEYEETAPELISEVKHLVSMLESAEGAAERRVVRRVRKPARKPRKDDNV